jgi:hypothetical protein
VSVDHGTYNQQDPSEQPIFLSVAPGMTVIVRHDYLTGENIDKDWWMGQVIHCAAVPVIRAFTTSFRSPMWIQA